MKALTSKLPQLGVKTDYCWVCEGLLLDSGGDPSKIRNEHHVVPQAFGGSDGPIVSLDSAHHDLLHLVAVKMLAGNPWEHLVKDMQRTHQERLLYLATRVVVASNFAVNDPNKRTSIVLSVSNSQNLKIKQLASMHGCSKTDLILRLLNAEYTRRFQPRKQLQPK